METVYWNPRGNACLAARNAAAFLPGGWYRTGDVGELDRLELQLPNQYHRARGGWAARRSCRWQLRVWQSR